MMNELIKRSEAVLRRLQDCLHRHQALRVAHEEIKQGYNDQFFTNKYMYVIDVQALLRAKDNYEEEFSRLLSTGASIAHTESKISFIPLMIKTQELVNQKPVTSEMMQKHLDTIADCENEVQQIENYYDEHESNLVEEKRIFQTVTQRK